MKTFSTSAKTLLLLREIARIEFRELNRNDRCAFSEAPADALIGFGDTGPAFALREITGEPFETTKDAVAVLIAGDLIEVHGTTSDGESICVAFNMQSIA